MPGLISMAAWLFAIIAQGLERAAETQRQIREFLYRYRLTLHPGKSRVYWCRDGIPFFGFQLFPCHARLVRPNVVRFRRMARWARFPGMGASLIPYRGRRWLPVVWLDHTDHLAAGEIAGFSPARMAAAWAAARSGFPARCQARMSR